MKYAGIGSRRTPKSILRVMEDFAYAMASDELTLRSGGADGADSAFEFGATMGGGRSEIYLPWKGFNGRINNAFLDEPTESAFKLAEQYHPGWKYLKLGAKKLIARNGHQVLGKDLDDPVDFVVCWTPDASRDGQGKKSGGTGQVLRIAASYEDIVVFNLADADDLADLKVIIGGDGIPLR